MTIENNCTVASGTVNIANTTCAPASGVTVFTADSSTLSIASSFIGYLGVDADSTNTADDSASNPLASAIDAKDWFKFDNFFRSWSLDSANSFPNADQRSRCTTNCKIFDWRLASGDGIFKNKTNDVTSTNASFTNGSNCPTAISGSNTITDNVTYAPSTFLTNAFEIVGDSIGDEDGLCESNESCIYSPNLGVYQGEGDYRTNTCTFSDGTVSSVKMYAYPVNGG